MGFDAACHGRLCAAKQLSRVEITSRNGCPWHPHTYYYVFNSSNLELFKRVHKLGAPWPEGICWYLAEKGLVEWLEYAHTHGAALSPDTCERLEQTIIRTSKVLECFKYAHQHGGGELHREYAVRAYRRGCSELSNYLKSQGCVV